MTIRLIEKAPSAYSYPLLIKNILKVPLIHAPEQEIVYRDRVRHTYRDFAGRVAKLAGALARLGVSSGDTVAVMDWDSHRYLECFFAVPMMGAVLHTVNVRLSPDQLLYTINHAEDDVILVNAEFLPLLAAIWDQVSTVKRVILLDDGTVPAESAVPLDGEYEALLAGEADTFDFPDFDENAMATTFYTTGTTGLPKGVYFSHRQLVLHTYGIMGGLSAYGSQGRVTNADTYMPITPMFHVHAWGMPYLMTLLGAKQVYPGRYEPEMLLRLVTEEGVTFSHCVPTILHMLVESPAVKRFDLSGWKVIIGGSALARGLCMAAMELGINVYTGYGMSETCPVLTLAHLKPHMMEWEDAEQATMRCRTGLPIPDVDLKVVDLSGGELPRDGKSTGEVVVRSPWLTQGYVKDPERGEELWADGWLHTGDIGFIDPEGYLQVTDRIKDVIKTGGEWISSLELESLISQHEAVSEAAVIGVADEKWGERPMALVVPKEEWKGRVTEEELRKFFEKFVDQGVIPKFGVPGKIRLVDAIAKTSVGKLNKKALREQYR